MNWHDYFMSLALMAAKKSKDPSTQTGCVLVSPKTRVVLATGFNGFPRGIERPDGVEREEKYILTEHAERNAIYCAARQGTSLEGAEAYCTFIPCVECMRALIQVGVTTIYHAKEISEEMLSTGRWGSCEEAIKMGEEVGIVFHALSIKESPVEPIRINGGLDYLNEVVVITN